ncbi:unnamed protein product [Lampetra planeri]
MAATPPNERIVSRTRGQFPMATLGVAQAPRCCLHPAAKRQQNGDDHRGTVSRPPPAAARARCSLALKTRRHRRRRRHVGGHPRSARRGGAAASWSRVAGRINSPTRAGDSPRGFRRRCTGAPGDLQSLAFAYYY